VCDDWETRNEPVKGSLNRGGRQSQLTVAHVAEGLAAHQRGDFTLSAKLLRR
jgi:hypothetical protein